MEQTGKLSTLKDLEAEIRRLEKERDKFRSPAESNLRHQRRAQILGEWAALKLAWSQQHLTELRQHAKQSGEAWLFDEGVLSADGVQPDGEGLWSFTPPPER